MGMSKNEQSAFIDSQSPFQIITSINSNILDVNANSIPNAREINIYNTQEYPLFIDAAFKEIKSTDLSEFRTQSILDQHRLSILKETKNPAAFVLIGCVLHKLYYEDKLLGTQKEFLEWTKSSLGFSKSTTYEYIISYRIYREIDQSCPIDVKPPMFQSHCQLLSRIPQKNLLEVWIDVSRRAPNGNVTTPFLENYIEKYNLRNASTKNNSQLLIHEASKNTLR
ncbi:hypothetical protein HK096_003762, partial [Nowakowskiella sp. JEL0078]